jgi:two-component system, LytTR family, response regulator
MAHALIIDDESRARLTLAKLIEMYCPRIGSVDEATNIEEAMERLKNKLPDIVFLDINLRGADGFRLLNELGTYDFKLIFVTAHQEFAIRAFKYAAVDYLLKPVNPEDLTNAVTRSLQSLNRQQLPHQPATLPEAAQAGHESNKKLVLKTSTEVFLVNSRDIIRLEADRNYTIFYLTEKRRIVMSVTLKEYEGMLTEPGFFRPHQSHLINMSFFEKLDKRKGGGIIMSDKSRVPVSVRKKEELNHFLNSINK